MVIHPFKLSCTAVHFASITEKSPALSLASYHLGPIPPTMRPNRHRRRILPSFAPQHPNPRHRGMRTLYTSSAGSGGHKGKRRRDDSDDDEGGGGLEAAPHKKPVRDVFRQRMQANLTPFDE